jgi:hypothetical protein
MRQCQVAGCTCDADYEVFRYDYHTRPGQTGPHLTQDQTCLFICRGHAEENEQLAQGERQPRGTMEYPYTNLSHAPGFTIYRPMGSAAPIL